MQSVQSPGINNGYSFLPWNNRKEDNNSGKTEAVLHGLKQLNLQSAQERERVLEEVHGVADSQVEETPELIDQRLHLLEEEIQLIKKRTAYDRALFLSPKYVLDRDFRLMFLRSELFDVRKAANRLVRFFESKKELWGDDKLARPITLDDFDEDSLAVLKHGSVQVLHEKDQSGRSVFFLASKHYSCVAWLELVSNICLEPCFARDGFPKLTNYLARTATAVPSGMVPAHGSLGRRGKATKGLGDGNISGWHGRCSECECECDRVANESSYDERSFAGPNCRRALLSG